jgi:predicted CoA-substrate-specific enzyme activase
MNCPGTKGEIMSDNRYFGGVDVGTSYIKAAITNEEGEMVGSYVRRSGADLQSSINVALEEVLTSANIAKDLLVSITATGFGRRNVSFANNIKTEISCHAKGVHHHFPIELTIIDIGGQDTKVIKINADGRILNFKMNRKCAAGTGTFLEEIAHRLDISMDEMNVLATKSTKEVPLGSYCTVFAGSEILTRIRDGDKVEDMVKSAFESVARRVIEMDTLEGTIVMTGGVVEHNAIITKILAKHVGSDIRTPPNPQIMGAFGAALHAKEEGK